MFDTDSELEHSSGSHRLVASVVSPWNPLRAFFGIVLEPRVYARILYVWLAFPLGLAYFVTLVTLLPLGAGLLLIWVGLLVLAFAGLLTWGLVHWERVQAAVLLGAELGPARRFRTDGDESVEVEQVGTRLAGVLEGLAVSRPQVPARARGLGGLGRDAQRFGQPDPRAGRAGFWRRARFRYFWVDSYAAAWLVSLFGVFLGFVTLHVHDGLGWVWAQLSKWMLVADPSAAFDGPNRPNRCSRSDRENAGPSDLIAPAQA